VGEIPNLTTTSLLFDILDLGSTTRFEKMSIENFPSLNAEEFTEACHHLDRQYCQASLGPERARWKLRLCNALCTDFSYGGFTTYIQIRRPLEFDLDHGDLSLDLDGFSFSDDRSHHVSIEGDKDMLDAEEADEVTYPQYIILFL
jgi:ubiquitin-like-conjugating enzyme ATG10